MKLKYLLIPFALLASTGVFATSKSATFGTWTFFEATSPQGIHYCSIINAVTNKNIGQNVVIKGALNRDVLRVDVYKDTWNRPQGASVDVMFDFVDNQPLTLPAYADAHILDVELPLEDTGIFLVELSKQPALQIMFPAGDEDSWTIPNRGAKNAVQKLVHCLRQK